MQSGCKGYNYISADAWVKVQNFQNPELKKIRIQNLLYAYASKILKTL